MLNVGDYVSRNSYNNDVIFKINRIENEIYYLKGISMRLYADSLEQDLRIEKIENINDSFEPRLDDDYILNRNEYFYLPGRILHLDAIFFDKWLHQNDSQTLINKGI